MNRLRLFRLSLLSLPALLLGALPALAAPPASALEWRPHVLETAAGPLDVELGVLEVPEHRAASDSRRLKLRMVRFRATTDRPGSPIVYLAGGPGGSGIDAARGPRLPLFLALRAHADVIALDQRGTGEGSETTCSEPFLLDPTRPASREQIGAAYAAAARACAERLAKQGVDLAGYTTRESVADLEALRRALGAEKLTLWGISYGTHLALATVAAHPDHVDRLLLAGIENLDETLKLPSDQQDLLADIAALATSVHPDLLGSIRRLLRELAAAPRQVELAHPLDGSSVVVALGPFDLQLAIADLLGGPESFAALPDLVARLEAGDWTALALLKGARLAGTAPNAMTVAMDCASGASAARRARIAAEAPETLLGDAINVPFPEICAGVTVPDLGDAFRAPVERAVPALLISGTLDGRTRPRQAEALAQGLPHAVHLVIEGAGHSDPLFLSSPRILETMLRFLAGEPIHERRIVLPPTELMAPRRVAEQPAEVLERYVGAYEVPGGGVRQVFRAGGLLYVQRDRNRPFPVRPSGPTEFFYEGMPTSLVFELGADGQVVAMRFRPGDGSEQRCPRR
jgi:pimeloyl-ACP methyl ester carboxylesterase